MTQVTSSRRTGGGLTTLSRSSRYWVTVAPDILLRLVWDIRRANSWRIRERSKTAPRFFGVISQVHACDFRTGLDLGVITIDASSLVVGQSFTLTFGLRRRPVLR